MLIAYNIVNVLSMFMAVVTVGADVDFGFPAAAEENPRLRHPEKKTPLFAPNRCAENELLYPADFNNDWVCDCKAGYLYHPTSAACYEPMRRGPCAASAILVLPPGSYLPRCQRNPCPQGDGFVPLRDGCYRLGEQGPCELAELAYVVALNVTTLQPDCLRHPDAYGRLENRFGDNESDEKEPLSICPVGSRRWLRRTCTPDAS